MAAEVEVAYARPDEQAVLSVPFRPGMRVRDAIEASKIRERFPEIDLDVNKVGVFGKVVKPDARVSAGDRVEIYRPLIADPKEARRKRATRSRCRP
ncbi:MAG TPA: RnfH family protein [Sedimenticola sp.]|nr:RnfH family protein [Sedimenticola sp.]